MKKENIKENSRRTFLKTLSITVPAIGGSLIGTSAALMPVCLSASHGAYGSIRMEPVFMQLGQAAGVAAYLAASRHQPVHDVKADQLRNELRENPLAQRKVANK